MEHRDRNDLGRIEDDPFEAARGDVRVVERGEEGGGGPNKTRGRRGRRLPRSTAQTMSFWPGRRGRPVGETPVGVMFST